MLRVPPTSGRNMGRGNVVGEIGRGGSNPGLRAALATILGAAILTVTLTGAALAARGSADLQWAQQVLKERGFDAGKPTGEMTAKTKAALAAFQRSAGLPATGTLDQATTDRLLAGHTGASAAVGNLAAGGSAAVKHGADAGGRDHPARETTPRAAPSGRVEAMAAMGGVAAISSLGGTAGAQGSTPRAAPSGAVTGAATEPSAGQGRLGEVEGGDLALEAPGWVRSLVIAVIVAILGGFGGLWWWSGRSRTAFRGAPLCETGHRKRLEPRFDGEVGGGSRLDAGLRAYR